ncbi:MAG TPA: hypothetical protein VLC93_03800 [Myxococcota bacterium]|nr:hypothetical protein [Myxococcota bacterium]
MTPVSPDVLRQAAADGVKLAEQRLVSPDGTIKVTEARLPEALRAVQQAMAGGSELERRQVSGAFAQAMSAELASRSAAAKGGAPAGATARLAVRNSEFHDVRGEKIRVEKSEEGVRYYSVGKGGKEVELAYNPFTERENAGITYLRALLSPKENRRVRAEFKRFKKRVNDIMAQVTDKDLMWSFSRLDKVRLLEGISRHDGTPLVNLWPHGTKVAHVDQSDFDDSTLPREDLALLFKAAMDIELPASMYSFASAAPLHDYFHDIAHFMGSTLSERVTASALHGNGKKRHETAVWSQEEERHGPVLDAIYNGIKVEGEPVLHAQLSYPIVRDVTAKGAKQMMLRREFAEIVAGTAYLVLKGNAKPDSNADKALDGIFRDELYHSILMQAGVKAAYNPSRIGNVVMILHNALQARGDTATDEVRYRVPEPLLVLETTYAFMAMEKRIHQFMKRFSIEDLRKAVGPVYATEKALQDAVDRGEHARTRHYEVEQNPDLSEAEVAALVKRFPERFDLANRNIRESELAKILDLYKANHLARPSYWLERKDFVEGASSDGSRVLERKYTDGSSLTLTFPKAGGLPWVKMDTGAFVTFDQSMADMSFREIGALMATDSAVAFAKGRDEAPDLERTDKRAWFTELVLNLSSRKTYQAAPLTIVRDVTFI